MSQASNQHIILIHGRGAKPSQKDLENLWVQALTAGIQRDAPAKLTALQQANVHMVYYAHHLQDFAEANFDEDLDLDNRQHALQALAARTKAKDFRRKHYESLPGKTPFKEFLMDLTASLGLGKLATHKAAPELLDYWRDTNGWASDTQQKLTALMHELTQKDKNVLIISHCMGSVLAWDSLWQLTHNIEADNGHVKRITQWITIGSPLSDTSIKRRLAGANNGKDQRYPGVLATWHNIAAEDDYMCHDKTVANDYRDMLNQRLIGDIRDHTIYNLAVRYGRSNPHSSVGYLIHPRTAQLLADWLD
jgi:alpha/beta hydrolase family protein DUF900